MKNTNRNPENDPERKQKQVPLRLSASLWNELVAWAEDDFRSLNGQIEYLLSEAVKRRKSGASNKTGMTSGQ
jgi:hypothetical protein